MVLLARSARLHVFVRRPRKGVAKGMSCHAAIIRALPSQTADCAVTVCRGRRAGWPVPIIRKADHPSKNTFLSASRWRQGRRSERTR